MAQLPELKVASNTKSVLASGIDEARYLYQQGNYRRAEQIFFDELEKNQFTTTDFLLFGSTLLANNKPYLAREFYAVYAQRSGLDKLRDDINLIFSESEKRYRSQNQKSISGQLNIGYGINQLYIPESDNFNKYIIECDGSLTQTNPILLEIKKLNLGSVAFFDDERQAVASLIDTSSQKVSLYYYYKSKGEWRKPIQLFNNNYNNAFPFVDEKNSVLYFASDNPTGAGGFDIYISSIRDGQFSKPINLGSNINTSQNEINPILIDGWLYFSSNGYISKGGYDIYRYKSLSDYSFVFNNCIDFNSEKDEVSILGHNKDNLLIARVSNQSTSITSYKKTEIASRFGGIVQNSEGVPINGAIILLKDFNSYTITDQNGEFSHVTIEELESLNIKVMAEEHKAKTSTISSREMNTIILEDAITLVTVGEDEYIHKGNPIESKSKSLEIDESQYYVILASTYDYSEAYSLWTSWVESFQDAKIYEYANGLYRIGFVAGESEKNALEVYKKARTMKSDIWILRPTTN